ncbi:MAG: hypothetical protein MUF10_11755 [Thermoanaerobaculaceae bacterium]|nr:hypothetical protein [Thermoanaerobaculaceae bacterium]
MDGPHLPGRAGHDRECADPATGAAPDGDLAGRVGASPLGAPTSIGISARS